MSDQNLVIVTHGLTMRLFCMRWFHWSVEYFESLENPENGGHVVLVRQPDLKYQLETPFVAVEPRLRADRARAVLLASDARRDQAFRAGVRGTGRSRPLRGSVGHPSGQARPAGGLRGGVTRGQGAPHTLQLLLGCHLLGEERGLDAVEQALEPADQLRLGDPELGVGGAA